MNKATTLLLTDILNEEEYNLLTATYEQHIASSQISIGEYYKLYFAEYVQTGILCGAFIQVPLEKEITVAEYQKLLNLFCDDYVLNAASLHGKKASAYGFINDEVQCCLDEKGEKLITEEYIKYFVKKPSPIGTFKQKMDSMRLAPTLIFTLDTGGTNMFKTYIDEDGNRVICHFHKRKETCGICGAAMVAYCDICDQPVCKLHKHTVGADTDVCPKHNTPEGIALALQRRPTLP